MEILDLLIFPSIIFWIFLAFFYEWLDRKIVARFQKRVGPYFAGKSGFLQPFADFIKLLSKEDITPEKADFLFTIASILTLFIPLFSLSFIPFPQPFLNFEGDVLILFYVYIFQHVLLQMIGFSSSSRFGVVGAGRLIFQVLTFGIGLVLAGIAPIILTGSFNLLQISKSGWFIFSAPIAFIVFIFSFLGELELLPFDIPLAKQEIVAGWETELSGKKLAFVKLGKNLEFLFSCCLIVSLFLGGGNFFEFLIKVTIIIFLFSFLRSIFARLRIDQTLDVTWKILIPLALLQLLLITIH
jgi:NADH-quinone oxidoreductase subunit H